MAGRFTVARQQRFLGLLEAGRNVEEACAAVGVSRPTVSKLAARGRAGRDPEAASFAAGFDRIRQGAGAPLSQGDLVRLLEGQARKGSVTAIVKLLALKRDDSERKSADPPADAFDAFDALDALAARRQRSPKERG